jgi:hypothetical protein
MKKTITLITLLFIAILLVSCSTNKDVYIINNDTFLKENSRFNLATYSFNGGNRVGTIFESYEELSNSDYRELLDQQAIENQFNAGKIIIGLSITKASSDGVVKLLNYKIEDSKIIFIFSSHFDVGYGLSTCDIIYNSYLIAISNKNISSVSIGIINELYPASGKSVYYH